MFPRWLQMALLAWQTWQRHRHKLTAVAAPFAPTRPRDTLQGIPRPNLSRQPPAPTMRWLQTEYLLKGVYLGLVLYAALLAGSLPPGEETLGACTSASCASTSPPWAAWFSACSSPGSSRFAKGFASAAS